MPRRAQAPTTSRRRPARTRSSQRSRGRGRWLEASIRVPLAAADRLGTLLIAAGSQGVITSVRELGRGIRRRTHETVRGFFPSSAPVRARLAVRAALNRAPDPALARAHVSWRELDAQLWEMDWREHFQPVMAGRSLAVVPPWNRRTYPGRRRVVIHPGMAFGTGQHATTLACLEAIERLASPPPPAALDVGTGTGVLAIALAKLGARRVVALDTDPQAIAAARANVRRNGVTGRVRLCAAPLETLARRPRRPATGDRLTTGPRATGARLVTGEPPRYPLVVANLYVDALVGLEPTLADCVVPGGHLVVSGVLRTQQGRLRAAFAPARWRVCAAKRRGSWVTTTFERRG
jgi:ribosomal protein L11 methyltransferase